MRHGDNLYDKLNQLINIRDLKIRRRRMSATAVMTEGDWEEVAVARREN